MAFIINKKLHKKIDTLQELMYDSVGSFYITDAHHYFLTGNKTQLDWLKLTNTSSLIGKNLTETPWGAHARQYINNNNTVIAHHKAFSFLEYGEMDNKIIVGMSEKQPFYHDNELVGVMGFSIPLSLNTLFSSKTLHSESLFIDIKRQEKLLVSSKRRPSLFLILQGYSTREVAAKLGLSKRTIEHHLEIIKADNLYHSLREILIQVKVL